MAWLLSLYLSIFASIKWFNTSLGKFIQRISSRIISAVILSVLYTLMFAFILYGSWQYRLDHTLFDLCYAFIYFILLYEGYRRIVGFLNLNIRHQKVNITRANLFKAIVVFILYSWFLITVVAVLPFYLFMDGFISPVDGGQELRMNYMINMVFATLYFAVLTTYDVLNQLQQTRLEAEKLESERTQAQMEILKTQVSPHFLFNSLNALSSLIEIDEEKAVRFVDELAEVFRYVTSHKDKELVPLKTEIEFINAYFFLLKIRFRDSLHLNMKIPERQLNLQLPPLTLQLLVENAIKHNIVSKEEPLTISMEVLKGKLVVRNNLQKRNSNGESTGVGLKNIISRYGYLCDEEVVAHQAEDEFMAILPLLKEGIA